MSLSIVMAEEETSNTSGFQALGDSQEGEPPASLSNSESNESCPLVGYNPTCNGTTPVCAQAPCDDPEAESCQAGINPPTTYADRCEMTADGAHFLYRGACQEPVEDLDELDEGFRKLTPAEIELVFAGIDNGALSDDIKNHGLGDFFDRYSEHWPTVVDEMRSLAFDLQAEGVYSSRQYVYLTQLTESSREAFDMWKEACSECIHGACGGEEEPECIPMCMEYCPGGSNSCIVMDCGGIGGLCFEQHHNTFCGAHFHKLAGGFLSQEIIDEIPPQRRTSYIQFVRNLMESMIQVASPAGEGALCSGLSCQEGLTCAADPNLFDDEPIACEQHSECPSQVCETVPTLDGNRYCRPVMKCYAPITTPGASCVDNPVCGPSLTCHAYHLGLPACAPANYSCSDNLDCCSGSCTGGTCENIKMCMNCANVGETYDSQTPCCPGSVEDPDEDINICVEMVPEDLQFESMVGLKTHMMPQEDPFDLDVCEFDWYQSYLSQLKEDPANFQRELSLLSFEFVASGEDFVDDYWDVNSRLKTVVERRRALRRWLIQVLRADIEDHETLLDNLYVQVQENQTISPEVKEQMLANYRDLASLKEQYYDMCIEVNETIETGDQRTYDGADADAERANELAILALKVERTLIEVHDATNTSPSFQELNGVRQDMLAMNDGWKRVDEWEHRVDKWTEIGLGALLGLLLGLALGFMLGLGMMMMAVAAVAGMLLGNMLFNSPSSIPDAPEVQGMYEALWGVDDETWPKVEVENYRTRNLLFITIYYFRIDVWWPKSYCPFPDRYDDSVLAVSGSCLKRFLFTDFEEERTSLVDPFVPANMTQEDLFRCRGEDQRDFVPLVNNAAEESIAYLLRRRKPGLDKRAIELAYPDISRGNKYLLDVRKDFIQQKAIEYLAQEFPDIIVSQEFVDLWAHNTYKLHFAFPKLSNHGPDIGYPKRGIVPYLSSMGALLGQNIEHNEHVHDEYTHRIGVHERLINHMTGDHGVYIDSNNQVYDLGESPQGEQVDPSGEGYNPNIQLSAGLGAPGAPSNPDGTIVSGSDDNSLIRGNLDPNSARNFRGALRTQFDENRRRNSAIKDRLHERSQALRENLRKQGGDPDIYDRYYSNLYSSMASPSIPFKRSNLSTNDFGGLSAMTAPSVPQSREGDASSRRARGDSAYGDGGHSSSISSNRGRSSSRRLGQRGRQSSRSTSGSEGVSGEGRTMSDEMMRAQEQIERSLSSLDRDRDRYLNSENDSLFEIITKSYFRNYGKLLERRSRERDRNRLEFEGD